MKLLVENLLLLVLEERIRMRIKIKMIILKNQMIDHLEKGNLRNSITV
jgi:hypothetical protein